MGAEISKTVENGKTVLTAKGNDLKYWEIEKLPVMKEWTKHYNLLVSSSEVMEDGKKKKVWSVSAVFDTVKDSNNFVAQVKKVKEAYSQFEETVKSTIPQDKPEQPKKTTKKTVETDESKPSEVISI